MELKIGSAAEQEKHAGSTRGRFRESADRSCSDQDSAVRISLINGKRCKNKEIAIDDFRSQQ